MGLKRWLRAALGDADWLYQIASRFNLTDAAKECRAAAARAGATVSFRSSGTYVQLGRERVIFSLYERPLIVGTRLANWAYFRTRLEFQAAADGTLLADCRSTARYRLPCGKHVTMLLPPEPGDFLSGYFAKGAPKAGDIALDVGAFCGETTLELAARVGPTGKVYALEPDAGTLALLRQNIQESGFQNIEVIPAVLWSSTGKMQFIADGNGASSLAAVGNRPDAGTSTVDALTPADLLRRIGRMPDFIKMDIEGAEVEVLEAMQPLLKDQPTRLAIASYHPRGGRKAAEIITPVLEAAGLRVETGNPEHLTTWAWKP